MAGVGEKTGKGCDPVTWAWLEGQEKPWGCEPVRPSTEPRREGGDSDKLSHTPCRQDD